MRYSRLKAQGSRLLVAGCLCLSLLTAPGMADAAISMSLDKNMIDFRAMDPGDTREVSDQGSYHNQITCSSTNSRTWYIKAHMVKPFTYRQFTIPAESLKWMVVSVGDGKGTVYNNLNTQNPFSTIPGTIYTSSDLDNTGREVKIQLRYILAVQKNQVAGAYDGLIRLTMTEVF